VTLCEAVTYLYYLCAQLSGPANLRTTTADHIDNHILGLAEPQAESKAQATVQIDFFLEHKQ